MGGGCSRARTLSNHLGPTASVAAFYDPVFWVALNDQQRSKQEPEASDAGTEVGAPVSARHADSPKDQVHGDSGQTRCSYLAAHLPATQT